MRHGLHFIDGFLPITELATLLDKGTTVVVLLPAERTSIAPGSTVGGRLWFKAHGVRLRSRWKRRGVSAQAVPPALSGLGVGFSGTSLSGLAHIPAAAAAAAAAKRLTTPVVAMADASDAPDITTRSEAAAAMSFFSYMCVDEEIDCPPVKMAVASASPSALIEGGRGIFPGSALPSERTRFSFGPGWAEPPASSGFSVECRGSERIGPWF